MAFQPVDEFRVPMYEEMRARQDQAIENQVAQDNHLESIMSLRERAAKVEVAEAQTPALKAQAKIDLETANATLDSIGIVKSSVKQQITNAYNKVLDNTQDRELELIAQRAPMMGTKQGYDQVVGMMKDRGVDMKSMPGFEKYGPTTMAHAKVFAKVADNVRTQRQIMSMENLKNANQMTQIDQRAIHEMEQLQARIASNEKIAFYRADMNANAARNAAVIKANKDAKVSHGDLHEIDLKSANQVGMPIVAGWLGLEIPTDPDDPEASNKFKTGVPGQLVSHAWNRMKAASNAQWAAYNSSPVTDQSLLPNEPAMFESFLKDSFELVSSDGETFYKSKQDPAYLEDVANFKQAWKGRQSREDYQTLLQSYGGDQALADQAIDILAGDAWKNPRYRFNKVPYTPSIDSKGL